MRLTQEPYEEKPMEAQRKQNIGVFETSVIQEPPPELFPC